ncbi:MAG: hypothetical protein KDD89_17310, partial [Anaerolineales bacterium]|nr:hypothetical protein [Anaerolineales bacterium]
TGMQLHRADGVIIRTQKTTNGTWIDTGPLMPYSVLALAIVPGTERAPSTMLSVDVTYLENEFLRVELNGDGDITRIYDKTNGREVLPEGAIANQFQAFEDRPLFWDAWDVDIFYEDKQWLAEPASSVTVVEAGPLRATLEIKRRILNSDYTERISLAHNRGQLDVDTTINWQEKHVLLKV